MINKINLKKNALQEYFGYHSGLGRLERRMEEFGQSGTKKKFFFYKSLEHDYEKCIFEFDYSGSGCDRADLW